MFSRKYIFKWVHFPLVYRSFRCYIQNNLLFRLELEAPHGPTCRHWSWRLPLRSLLESKGRQVQSKVEATQAIQSQPEPIKGLEVATSLHVCSRQALNNVNSCISNDASIVMLVTLGTIMLPIPVAELVLGPGMATCERPKVKYRSWYHDKMHLSKSRCIFVTHLGDC